MNRVLAIAGKEIRSSLSSPLAYLFILLFVVVAMGAFFVEEAFFANNDASLRGLFKWMPALMVLLAPALTMRIWAEEEKLGTYEVLATVPLTSWQLVLGKFLGAFVLMILGLAFTAGLPIVCEIYGDPDWGPIFGGYFAALMLGSAYVAVGLVSSVLSQDQFLALFLGWALCGLTLLPEASFWDDLLSSSAVEAFRAWGFQARFHSVERGVIAFKDLAFYLSATAFFIYLNVTLVRWRRFAS